MLLILESLNRATGEWKRSRLVLSCVHIGANPRCIYNAVGPRNKNIMHDKRVKACSNCHPDPRVCPFIFHCIGSHLRKRLTVLTIRSLFDPCLEPDPVERRQSITFAINGTKTPFPLIRSDKCHESPSLIYSNKKKKEKKRKETKLKKEKLKTRHRAWWIVSSPSNHKSLDQTLVGERPVLDGSHGERFAKSLVTGRGRGRAKSASLR